MIEANFIKISEELISDLNEKTKEIIVRRFGLRGRKKETLESIGKSFGITRERVRQIQNAVLKKIEPKLEKFTKVVEEIKNYLKKWGGARKEERLLEELAPKSKNELLFFLVVSGKFFREKEDDQVYTFWALEKKISEKVRKILKKLCQELEKNKRLFTLEELAKLVEIEPTVLSSFLEISKKIKDNKKGFFGLIEWPEVTPRGVKDLAYLVLKEAQKPLHFSEIAKLIANANVATVHNELIRDKRFVLVGRGIYALREWGYFPGQLRDVILEILKRKGRAMTKEEIIQEVKKQRLFKESTILVNLSNKNYFVRDKDGKYWIKTAEI